ncbi:hypothetical protein JCM3765_002914 [Sporobolomyces pararoseus]
MVLALEEKCATLKELETIQREVEDSRQEVMSSPFVGERASRLAMKPLNSALMWNLLPIPVALGGSKVLLGEIRTTCAVVRQILRTTRSFRIVENKEERDYRSIQENADGSESKIVTMISSEKVELGRKIGNFMKGRAVFKLVVECVEYETMIAGEKLRRYQARLHNLINCELRINLKALKATSDIRTKAINQIEKLRGRTKDVASDLETEKDRLSRNVVDLVLELKRNKKED